ncbi:MAG TPA: metallophosphoesterase [Allosphingosinicella sp.]|jgi:3',5'-cyclic AMP phosphodiesterase CpdA
MLIAQITDIHLGFEPGNPDELNRRRLDATLRTLVEMKPRPDLLLMTGDLADAGDDDLSYAQLKEAAASLPFPFYPAVGNHDDRACFARHFPDVPRPGGFFQYAIEAGPVRILVLDTLDEGRHGGAYCDTRAAWLEARLAEQPERPVLIALHHPPVESGLSWMSENPDSAWMRRLEAVVSGRSNIVGMAAGHLHRPLVTRFAGHVLAICPATAPQLALDLAGIDPEAPDERPMIVEEPPGFALHLWTGRSLVTHFGRATDDPVMARFTPAMQPLVRHLAAERRGG